MRDQVCLPDLSFPSVEYSPRETPWNLNLLFYAGAAKEKPKVAMNMIQEGRLGGPKLERSELLVALHAEILGDLETGGARSTADMQIRGLRELFGFGERKSLALTVVGITGTYVAWTDSLYHRVQLKKTGSKNQNPSDGIPIKQKSAFTYGATVANLLDRVLERHSSVLELTRLRHDNRRKSPFGVEADKQNLADTFSFGHMLQDICDGLPLELLLAPTFPVVLKFRSGQEIAKAAPKTNSSAASLGNAWFLVNLRIEAEMYMFIGQTGINRAQAAGMQLHNFFYVSHLEGYHVKDYKARRQGEVLFEIFKDYKSHFERYLQWRKALFSDSALLFPFVGFPDTRQSRRANGMRVKSLCLTLNVPYISPQTLRNTRVNWLLRKSADPELTAEMSQHATETLLSVYERPSLQLAMVETMRFWSTADPNLTAKTESVGPGSCTGAPKAVHDLPREAPEPDCVKAAGCLWCENHRDIDSQDHIWALTSFKHLKVIEVSRYRQAKSDNTSPPSQLAIERINEKLRWYSSSSKVREEWVTEAEVRIEEGEYHQSFASEIYALEGME
jgi:hypothetical protein